MGIQGRNTSSALWNFLKYLKKQKILFKIISE